MQRMALVAAAIAFAACTRSPPKVQPVPSSPRPPPTAAPPPDVEPPAEALIPPPVSPTEGAVEAQLAEGCASESERTLEVLPRRKGAGRLRIFTSPTGFDLFWLEVEIVPAQAEPQTAVRRGPIGLPSPRIDRATQAKFHQMWAPLDESGKLLAKPVRLPVPSFTRIADNGEDVVAIVKDRTPDGVHVGTTSLWRCTRRGTQPPKLSCAKTTALPNGPEGHGGGYGLAWDAAHAQWGISWEEHRSIDPNKPGHVHSVLRFARATKTGKLVEQSVLALSSSEPHETASLSNWGAPMMWHPEDGFAIVWGYSNNASKRGRVVLTHVDAASDVRHTTVTTSSGSTRAVVAHDGRRYGIGWQQWTGKHHNLRFSTVERGRASAALIVGDEGIYSGGAILEGGNGTFVLGWHESPARGRRKKKRARAFRMRIAGSPMVTETTMLSDPEFEGDDWPVGITFDGCRFAWAEEHHLNPSAARVRLFQ